jgi:hypothetical protein
MLAIRKMPRMMADDAVPSITSSLIIIQPVSLVCLISQVLTGCCRVVTMFTNAAGLSIESQNALHTHSTMDSETRSELFA